MWLILTCTCFRSEPASLCSHVIDTYLYLFLFRACIPKFTCDWYLLVLVSGLSLCPSVPYVTDTYLYLFLVWACVPLFHMWLILTCTCFWFEPASLHSTCDWYLLVLVSSPSLHPSVPHVIDTYLYLFLVQACIPPFHMWLILTCTCFWSEPASLSSTCDWYLYLFLVWACISPFYMWLILTCTCFRSEPVSLCSTLWLILTCSCFLSEPAFLHSTYDWYLVVLVSGPILHPSVPHIWWILTCTCFLFEPASLHSTYDWYLVVLVSGLGLHP